MMPNDLPPWPVVYQQTRRWIRAGCFEIMVEDLRSLLREFVERKPQPTAMVVDSRTAAVHAGVDKTALEDAARLPLYLRTTAAIEGRNNNPSTLLLEALT